MRQLSLIFLVFLFSLTCFAQDPLAGRWEGKIQSIQGTRDTAVVFKNENGVYSGRSAGMRPGTEMALKNVKLEGSTVTANGEMETPQAVISIAYRFELKGETMKGQGSLDFGGQAVSFDLDLKRVSPKTDGPVTVGNAGAGGQRQPQSIAQPQQKPGLDYFAGKWDFRYVGRESALGSSPREGTATFTKSPDGKSLAVLTEGRTPDGTYKESGTVTFDDSSKQLTIVETMSTGVKLRSVGDWSSPISIRFNVDPLKIKNQTIQLKRIISIVAAHSFTVTDEISENGGPFVRLGSGVYSRAGAQ